MRPGGLPAGLLPLAEVPAVVSPIDVQGEGRLVVDGVKGGDAPVTITDRGLKQEFRFEDFLDDKDIGSGAQATVRRCRHRDTRKMYAMKRLNCGEMSVSGIQQEIAQIVEVSSHDNLVKSHDAYFRDGYMYILMEYMHWGSLSAVLDRGLKDRPGRPNLKVPEPELSSMMQQVLLGLQSLHSRGILHRDLKPSNILANKRGQIKICDFGVSRLVSTQRLAQTAVGARAYLAPERVRGDEYGLPADIWAVGICAGELALGDYPWKDMSVHALSDETASGKLRMEWAQHASSPELRHFVDCCMQQAPQDRWDCARLLTSDFICKHRDSGVNLAKWLAEVHGDDRNPWRKQLDPKSGKEFYHNTQTGQKQWSRPRDFEEAGAEG